MQALCVTRRQIRFLNSLTNKEALILFCSGSVVKLMGSRQSMKELYFLYYFLRTLQQVRAQPRRLYLFYDEEQIIFFKKWTLFSKRAPGSELKCR